MNAENTHNDLLSRKITEKKEKTSIWKRLSTTADKVFHSFLFFILITIIIAFLFTWGVYSLLEWQCEKDYPYGNYEMVYKVYYTPTNVKTYTIKHNRPIINGSDRGTNYIKKYDDGYVIKTNAPIEIVRYVKY